MGISSYILASYVSVLLYDISDEAKGKGLPFPEMWFYNKCPGWLWCVKASLFGCHATTVVAEKYSMHLIVRYPQNISSLVMRPWQTQPCFSSWAVFLIGVHAYWSWRVLPFFNVGWMIIIIVKINYIQICLCSSICNGTNLLLNLNLIFCWTKHQQQLQCLNFCLMGTTIDNSQHACVCRIALCFSQENVTHVM